MKIYICAIMKNEAKNIARFYESCKAADGIYVLDTGSTDNSVELMRSMGGNVTVSGTKYDKFRFDMARNDAIAMLPKEDAWVIHLDLDEYLVGDWKAELSALEDPRVTNVNYMYVFSLDKDRKPLVYFIANKITRNGFYKFKFPIHENIFTEAKEVVYHAQKFRIEQEQDKGKPTDYKEKLEEAVKEYPDEHILSFYLLKEYFISENYGRCIDLAKEMQKCNHVDFKMVSCLIAARAFDALGVPDKKEEWLLLAAGTNAFRREAWMDLLRYYASKGRLADAFWAGNNVFHVNNRRYDFIEMAEAWSKEPHAIFVDVCKALGFSDIAKPHLLVLNDVMTLRQGEQAAGLVDLISHLEGKNLTIAEIGSYAGESTELFAKSEKVARVYAIDPWQDGVVCEHITFQNMEFVESLIDERNLKNPKIVKLKSDNATAATKILVDVDFAYIDAVHTYEAVTEDIKTWFPKVKAGGYIGGHDYHPEGFPGVVKAVNEFCEANGFKAMVFKDSSWLVKKPA